MPIHLVVITGRTACGKSTVAEQVAKRLNCDAILIGKRIKDLSEQLEWVAEIRARGIPFSTEFVASVILEDLKPDAAYAVLDASIGVGQALALVKQQRPIKTTTTFVLDCPVDIRRSRFNARDRQEADGFFENREKLFDEHFDSSLEALSTHGPLDRLNATQEAWSLTDQILERLDAQELAS